MRLLLHIGMPKTGTSLIQAVLMSLRDQLASQHAWLPLQNLAATRIAVEAFPADSPIRSRADVLHIREAMTIEEALDQAGPPTAEWSATILSSEYFSECRPERLEALLRSAGYTPSSTTVLVALRRQDRILVSGFNEEVKSLSRTTPLGWNPDAAHWLDWYEALAPWASVFGKQAVKVQVFDRDAAARASLTGRLLDACGFAYDPALVSQKEEELRNAENRSLPATLLAFKFAANRVTRPGELDWFVAEALERGVGHGTFGLPDTKVREILDHYRESNRRVASEYLGEDGDLFDDVIGKPTHTTLDVDAATIAEVTALCAAAMDRPAN
ncbi:hypothetical protein [Promicromonospora panici]|uniref:hypothetical protein n=1 Tax=Promicromonospora panici TaxID=2219658 RepID=UPI00101D7911|nr:hypothetical protein [Promicromonospora panici]